MIKGHGNIGGKIMFIADSGTRDDLTSGYALSGSAERMLRQLCNTVEIKLDTCYRTLLYKDHITGLGFHHRRDKKLIEEFKLRNPGVEPEQILKEEVQAVNPNVIVVMGNHSLRTLTGNWGIQKYRGSILVAELDRKYKVIPTFSPQHIFEAYQRFFITAADYENKLKTETGFSEVRTDSDLVWICRTVEAANNFFRRHRSNCEFVTFDIETWHGAPTCISFCFDGRESTSIPFYDEKMSMADGMLLMRECAKILASDIPKVNQNIKYDWHILERFGLGVNNIVGDTMLAAHTLYPEFEKNLGFLTSLYTTVPYFKDEGKESTSFPPDVHHLTYNAKDALVTHKIYSAQRKELEADGLLGFYDNRIMPLFHLYKRIENRGVRVDDSARRRLLGKYQTLVDVNQDELTDLAGPINPRSPDQVGKLIYEDLKFPARVKTTEGVKRYNTSRKILEELEIMHGDENRLGLRGREILARIILARRLAKVIEYIETPIHPDGRWRCGWNIVGTETGRSSARKHTDRIFVPAGKKLKEINLGRSLQTITKHGFKLDYDEDADEFSDGEFVDLGSDLREMFVPSDGHEFVEIDQSQAEARHVAVLANDWETLALLEKTTFNKNKHGVKDDLHAITASWVTGKPFEDITKEDRQKNGKPARHGGNYDMSPPMLAMTEKIPIPQAAKILEKFHEASPKIRGVFHAEIRAELHRSRVLKNPFGRRRQFFDRLDREMYKQGYAHIPQGTVSDHQKFAMLRADPAVREFAHFLVEAHDSTLAEVRIGHREEYARIMKRELMQPIDYSGCSLSRDFNLVVPVEMNWGRNWQECGSDETKFEVE
jgi:DNA polymerase-1